MSEVQNNESNAPKEKVQITVSAVKELLNQGLDRKEIAVHFGMSVAAMARDVWGHPALKNLKAKRESNIILVDDRTPAEIEASLAKAAKANEKGIDKVVENTTTTDDLVSTSVVDAEEDVQAPASNGWGN